MDRSIDKEKISRKSRDEHRDRDTHKDRDRDSQKERDRESDRDRRKHRSKDHYHHSRHRSKDRDEESDEEDRRRHKRHKDEEEDEENRRSRARSRDRESRREKSEDREFEKRERSGEVERSNKRKERGESEERREAVVEKRSRVSNEKRERRRFEDRADDDDDDKDGVKNDGKERRKVEDDSKGLKGEVRVKKEDVDEGNGGDHSSRKRERKRFGDKAVKEEGKVKEEDSVGKFDGARGSAVEGRSGSIANDDGLESHMLSRTATDILAPNHPPIKVSSITTTNENNGVNITGSHEVPGKSSTDGTTTGAGNSDALAIAKKALQKHKELSEKLKKLPLLNKSAALKADAKEGSKAPSNGGILPTPSLTSVKMAPAASGSFSTLPASAAAAGPLSGMDAAKYEAVKRAQELAAKMGFRQDPEFAPLINLFPGQTSAEVSVHQKPAKAPVLRLDALGREIDEQGNVVNVTKPNSLSTLKVNINKQKKDAFQILKPDLDVNPEENPFFDPRMGINKNKILRPKRMTFQFVEEGKWSRDAEIIRLKNQFGDAQARELRAKQVQLAKAKAEPNINPNLIEVSERVITKEKEKPKDPIPELEWWDVPLLHSNSYPDATEANETDQILKVEKITIYVEHPRPIEPPAEPAPPPPQPLKLTKKEQKKLRTQRRLAKEKERQEMIRQGLLEPPKPKVKMSNLMRVLGSEATQDPTRLEMEIRAAAAEREQAHVDRNIARKLTPAERREKKERKLFDDPTTLETIVSIYKVNDLSHPQNRFKVDVNAQENRLTGCLVIFEGFCVVVVEGGTKSIKRYGKLMLRRINWAAKVENEDGEQEDDEEKPANKCVLVWQGSVAKPSFSKFFVHECRTEAAARKIFNDAGVGHYWDLAANFSDDQV